MTGVQTCALTISRRHSQRDAVRDADAQQSVVAAKNKFLDNPGDPRPFPARQNIFGPHAQRGARAIRQKTG